MAARSGAKSAYKSLSDEQRIALVQEIAEEMVRGWSYIHRNEAKRRVEKSHGLTEKDFRVLELDARKVLTNSWDEVSRQDLVALNLHRLQEIYAEAVKYRQMSVAQACIATMNRSVGADRPAEN